jgi:hypothetical protein
LGPNLALTEKRENRPLTAIHCMLRDDGSIAETYQGAVREMGHPEAIGLFKMSDGEILSRWKRLCMRHGNLFAGQTLPCDAARITCADRKDFDFDEVNTAADYLRLIERHRGR